VVLYWSSLRQSYREVAVGKRVGRFKVQVSSESMWSGKVCVE